MTSYPKAPKELTEYMKIGLSLFDVKEEPYQDKQRFSIPGITNRISLWFDRHSASYSEEDMLTEDRLYTVLVTTENTETTKEFPELTLNEACEVYRALIWAYMTFRKEGKNV